MDQNINTNYIECRDYRQLLAQFEIVFFFYYIFNGINWHEKVGKPITFMVLK